MCIRDSLNSLHVTSAVAFIPSTVHLQMIFCRLFIPFHLTAFYLSERLFCQSFCYVSWSTANLFRCLLCKIMHTNLCGWISSAIASARSADWVDKYDNGGFTRNAATCRWSAIPQLLDTSGTVAYTRLLSRFILSAPVDFFIFVILQTLKLYPCF